MITELEFNSIAPILLSEIIAGLIIIIVCGIWIWWKNRHITDRVIDWSLWKWFIPVGILAALAICCFIDVVICS
jgi:hypothetical protein